MVGRFESLRLRYRSVSQAKLCREALYTYHTLIGNHQRFVFDKNIDIVVTNCCACSSASVSEKDLPKGNTTALLRAAGDLQDQQKVEESEEASKLSVFVNKKQYAKHRFCLRRQRNHLEANSYFLEHNHKLSKFLYDRLLVNLRLTEDELGTCSALLKYGTLSCEVRQFVADEFGKIPTTQDIYNYRRKCRPALLNDVPSVLAKLRETGRVLVWQSEEGHYSHICFSRWQQIALFRRFPDVVNVDGTHATNRFGNQSGCSALVLPEVLSVLVTQRDNDRTLTNTDSMTVYESDKSRISVERDISFSASHPIKEIGDCLELSYDLTDMNRFQVVVCLSVFKPDITINRSLILRLQFETCQGFAYNRMQHKGMHFETEDQGECNYRISITYVTNPAFRFFISSMKTRHIRTVVGELFSDSSSFVQVGPSNIKALSVPVTIYWEFNSIWRGILSDAHSFSKELVHMLYCLDSFVVNLDQIVYSKTDCLYDNTGRFYLYDESQSELLCVDVNVVISP
ncbi:hypothetical protein CLF_109358 [Clonorchis sinensis]|uniref:Uncharacterized protein n=1 Tax=Clonorchis sinensis TaxID=79923 RepID=G7YSI3_CLOSI|nr:hypothetical protein CLF_109358 [Clonorchis sinensis]